MAARIRLLPPMMVRQSLSPNTLHPSPRIRPRTGRMSAALSPITTEDSMGGIIRRKWRTLLRMIGGGWMMP